MFNSWFYVRFYYGSCYLNINKCDFDVSIVG